jgi:hypothetical protein
MVSRQRGTLSHMTEHEEKRRAEQREQALPPPEQRAASIPTGAAGKPRRWQPPTARGNVGAERRWRRKALADYWGVSDRTIDRMRADGRLGKPCGYVGAGRLPIWSDAQRIAAERGELEHA